MSRTAHCRDCDQDFTADTDTGRLPTRCPACTPESLRLSRDYKREMRVERDALRARVEQLEQQLRAGRPDRVNPRVPASRQTVAIAVRRTGTAEGARQTASRLRELAAEALAWADALGCRETSPDVLDEARKAAA